MVLGRITTGRHTHNLGWCHPIPTNQQSTSINPHFYAGWRSCHNPPNLSWLGTGTGICWIAYAHGKQHYTKRNTDLISHQSWDWTTNLMIVKAGWASRAKKDEYEADRKRHFRQVCQFTGLLQTNKRHDRRRQKLDRTNEHVRGFGARRDAMQNVRVGRLRCGRCLCCRRWERPMPRLTWSQIRRCILVLPRTSLPTTSTPDHKWACLVTSTTVYLPLTNIHLVLF